jgi:nucleoside-diphosphate-sugar epimerase
MSQDKKIIIGTGMIGKSLTDVDFGRPTLVLAAGVSDSQETRPEAFEREVSLVEHAIASHPDMHVLYCSTCSVDSGIQTPYTSHKLAMEKRVQSKAVSSHVFRLPQVVGRVHNRTLVSYFVESILQDRVLSVQTRATRNLLDVRDFARVASLVVCSNIGEDMPLNIAASTQVPVQEIVVEIAKVLDRTHRIECVDAGYSQAVNTEFLKRLLPAEDHLFDPAHWRSVVQHYVPLIASDLAGTVVGQ